MDLTTIATTVGVVGAALFAFFRTYRTERKDEKKDVDLHDKASVLIEHYKGMAENAQSLADRRQERLEEVEKERNHAVEQLGELRATVTHMTSKIEILQDTCERLEEENKVLTHAFEEQRELLQAMFKLQNELLETMKTK